MKKIIKTYIVSAVVMTAGCLMQSCQSEAPFSVDGEGRVRLNVEVDSRLTRAVEGEEDLKANARIYITIEATTLAMRHATETCAVEDVDSNVNSDAPLKYFLEKEAGTESPAMASAT